MKKNKFQIKREATYLQLLQSGMKCFSEKGYAATTLGDIVERTGHTKGAFYGHFESKEQLFEHILDYQIQLSDGWTNTPKEFSPADTTLEEVITITLTRLGHMLQGTDDWSLVLVDFYHHAKQDPKTHAMFKQKYREWVDEVESLILVLQGQGWIPQDRDIHIMAKQVMAFNEGYIIFMALCGDTDTQTHIKGLVKLMT